MKCPETKRYCAFCDHLDACDDLVQMVADIGGGNHAHEGQLVRRVVLLMLARIDKLAEENDDLREANRLHLENAIKKL